LNKLFFLGKSQTWGNLYFLYIIQEFFLGLQEFDFLNLELNFFGSNFNPKCLNLFKILIFMSCEHFHFIIFFSLFFSKIFS
jgi:hypothetical protein